jgi:hypothetical protein
MGLFDFLSKNKGEAKAEQKGKPEQKSEREIARLERLVENKLSQNYDRQEAIQQLGRMGTARSVQALLKRFNWTMDPTITDHEEKEEASRGIANAGDAALEPIRQYCKRAQSITWALKSLKAIVPEERIVDELLSILDQFDTDYVRNPEPKVQLIAMLEDYPSEDVRVAVEPFLGDISEPVRFTAVTTVFAMNTPESTVALIEALNEEESLRVKNRICQGLAERSWEIPEEHRSTCADALPSGYRLRDGKIIAA